MTRHTAAFQALFQALVTQILQRLPRQMRCLVWALTEVSQVWSGGGELRPPKRVVQVGAALDAVDGEKAFELSSLVCEDVRSQCCVSPAVQAAAEALQDGGAQRVLPRFQDVGTGARPPLIASARTSLHQWWTTAPPLHSAQGRTGSTACAMFATLSGRGGWSERCRQALRGRRHHTWRG